MDGDSWVMGGPERASGELHHGCLLSLVQEQPWQSHLPRAVGKGTQQPIAHAEALGNDFPSLSASGGASITHTASLSQRDLTGKSAFSLEQLLPPRIFASVKNRA